MSTTTSTEPFEARYIGDKLVLCQISDSKQIGEISPGAIWVSVGDKFEEYEEWWWSIERNISIFKIQWSAKDDWDKKLAIDPRVKKVCKVKCSQCQTFH